jgi:hypothetical protein
MSRSKLEPEEMRRRGVSIDGYVVFPRADEHPAMAILEPCVGEVQRARY